MKFIKSLNRKLFFTLTTIISFSGIIFLESCNDSSIHPIPHFPNEIIGQFSNWDPENKDSLLWRVWIDSVDYLLVHTKVSPTGNFELKLSDPPSEILLNYIKLEREDSIYIEMKDSIHFSDTTAKFYSLTLEHYQRIPFPIRCGNTNGFGIDSNIGDYQIHYYYFDRPTEVNGSWYTLLKNQFYPDYERTIITKYNQIKFNKGWNQIIIELVSLENDRRIFEVSNENRVNTEWILIALPNEFVRLL